MTPSVSAGTRDHQGRAVVQVCTRGPLWPSRHASSAELTRLLLYFHGIPRWDWARFPPFRPLGVTVCELMSSREGLCLQPWGPPVARSAGSHLPLRLLLSFPCMPSSPPAHLDLSPLNRGHTHSSLEVRVALHWLALAVSITFVHLLCSASLWIKT